MLRLPILYCLNFIPHTVVLLVYIIENYILKTYRTRPAFTICTHCMYLYT